MFIISNVIGNLVINGIEKIVGAVTGKGSNMADTLYAFRNLLRIKNPAIDIFRLFMWYLNRGMANLLSAMTKIFYSMYDLLDIWSNEQIQGFIGPWLPVIWALGALSMVWMGFRIMNSKRVDYSKKANNMVLAIVMLIGMPFIMTQTASLVHTAVNASETQNDNPVVSIYKGNMTDLMTIDKGGWKDNSEPQNGIKDWKDIDTIGGGGIIEPVKAGDWGFGATPGMSSTGKSIIKKKLASLNGKNVAIDMDNVVFKHDYYYQFTWHPWLMFFEIAAMLVTYIVSSIKVATLIGEFNLLGIIGQGIAITGFDDSRRNIKILVKIRDIGAMLFLTAIMVKFYGILLGLAGSLVPTQIGKLLAVWGFSIFAMKGPNFIGEIFGIQPTAGSLGSTLMGLGSLTSMAKGAGHMAAAPVKAANSLLGKSPAGKASKEAPGKAKAGVKNSFGNSPLAGKENDKGSGTNKPEENKKPQTNKSNQSPENSDNEKSKPESSIGESLTNEDTMNDETISTPSVPTTKNNNSKTGSTVGESLNDRKFDKGGKPIK